VRFCVDPKKKAIRRVSQIKTTRSRVLNVYWHVPPVPHSRPPGFCGQRRRSSARACQDSVPFVSRWYAVPASTMGEALYTTRSRVLNRNDTLQRAPDASRTPGLCGPPAAAAENVSGWRNYALSFACFPRGGATARTSNPRPGPRARRRGHLTAYRRVLCLLLGRLLGRRLLQRACSVSRAVPSAPVYICT
jgi:hypothetical protein